ncbi:biotin/lipoyl-containing protein [Sphingopyxis sp. DBS4]|uniref:acetyl-CoA carboxylase biotin carboxyl carrier protein n=1 Tax=Sphingopyxis sp. DBS4 TaxID=2968500 RepID=UPI00214C65E3|nr:biotin/lipoyl-containing protein [Sphingopyxis sp. DBS4]
MEDISKQDVESLIKQFDSSDWRELHVKLGNFELFLSKNKDSEGRSSPFAAPAAAPAVQSAAPTAAPPASSDAPAPTVAPAQVSQPGAVPPGGIVVKASSLGTFYRAPKPGAPVFTEVGARVAAGAELCLIEVMKLFTTLRTETAGIVREIYAQDGELVEFDQPLFLIEPSDA